ncbi:MAG TPA: Hsp20/alpha crystallin family protein [Vicinamibacterales bacterium]|nr:Hsp20/alpha crystallin family protein [Vicinamibacterales bacterium]
MARVYVERRDLPSHLRRLLEQTRAAAECTPPMDVLETAGGLEIRLDVPGVRAADIDIVFADSVLLIAGQKLPHTCEHADAGFHMAERAFGRFARAIRVDGAFDAGRAAATLNAGELRVTLPRIEERRGAQIRIPIR